MNKFIEEMIASINSDLFRICIGPVKAGKTDLLAIVHTTLPDSKIKSITFNVKRLHTHGFYKDMEMSVAVIDVMDIFVKNFYKMCISVDKYSRHNKDYVCLKRNISHEAYKMAIESLRDSRKECLLNVKEIDGKVHVTLQYKALIYIMDSYSDGLWNAIREECR